MSIESRLMQAWLQRGWLARLLWPLSRLFALLTALRRGLYACGWRRVTRLPVPVLVVGNIFVGGTGKTPLTIWLVAALRERGYVPGVISRGYGAAASASPRLVEVGDSPLQCGDEPLLIARQAQCPVMVGRSRVAAALALLRAHPEVTLIISDDGLQHYALARDVEIILSDSRGSGNGWLLPAGPLRETPQRRRDFTVVNLSVGERVTSGAIGMQLLTRHAEQLQDRTAHCPLPALATLGTRVVAAAGIGNPERFFATLRSAGLVIAPLPLPDHYDFAINPFAALDADLILITEKDAVKCEAIEAIQRDPRIWVVPVIAHIDGPLAQSIVEKLREHTIA